MHRSRRPLRRAAAAAAAAGLVVLTSAAPAAAAPGDIVTVAGNGTFGFAGDGGPATTAQITDAAGLLELSGALYVADTSNHRVRLVDAGLIETVAGTGTPGSAGDGEPPLAAQLDSPRGLAADAFGTIYVADTGNHAVRAFTPGGTLDTVAGTLGSSGYAGDGGAATSALLDAPVDVAVDPDGYLYVVDAAHHVVRRVEPGPGGAIETVVGTGVAGFAGDGGPAAAVQLQFPAGIELAPDGRLWIADAGNYRIRVWDIATDTVTTVAGTGVPGDGGDGGPATSAQLYDPRGLAADDVGNVYVADTGGERVRRIGPDGVIYTVAGTGSAGYNGDGIPAETAQLTLPVAVEAVSGSDELFLTDTGNRRVRLVTAAADVPAGAPAPLVVYGLLALAGGGVVVELGRRRAVGRA